MKLSLKYKFLLPTVTTTILCLILMSVLSYMKSSKALENSIASQLEYVSGSISKQVGNWIMERKNDLNNFSEETIFADASNPSSKDESIQSTANRRLEKIKRNNTFFELISIADPGGIIIASSETGMIGSMNVSNRSYFKEALSGNISVSEVIKSKVSGNPVFCISSPVKQNNTIVGVLFGAINLNHFTKEFVDSEKVGETGYAYISSNEGIILAHPDKSKILTLDISQYDFGRQMLKQKKGLINYSFEGVNKTVAFAEEPNLGWIVASTADNAEIFAPVYQMRNTSIIIGVVCVIIIAAIIFLITQSIVNPINRIINGMEEGANQVASASIQVSSASQSLAEGSSQQASSIEETSASIEEMSSMTKKNAENSSNADRLMKQANHVVTEANESMKQLTLSMNDISKASEETSKIIKTIDEIAFQTNLLALNAAVEAARAGEAGAGFAVVADEVRNLAMRAANAAKDTAELIKDTVKKISDGSAIVLKTSDSFRDVAEISSKVGDLVVEISEASRDQSDGIDQVNNAIYEMDKVVQQNATNAEESASASEEMSSQAEQLRDYVADLVLLVSGKEDRTNVLINKKKAPSFSYKSHSIGLNQNKITATSKQEIKSNQIIPFDENESFDDF
ncbi:methyl-accepting chemotaxis protein [Desulfobacula phenolica]|uniref:Methyl-accepting chemotaxis sensory transducer with Cache sensor n=1 Tax=Desulfobacula phenolica TaxID=90732 RepID=A0A1H2HVT0_9BACT|nr:methyl-accepting chemotaxis protein [Desulfobacula phenolica]SDU36003.1 methyl-accepting chemotaxis sensory transducer with Cache sensor [Desulfobacula phenolica]